MGFGENLGRCYHIQKTERPRNRSLTISLLLQGFFEKSEQMIWQS